MTSLLIILPYALFPLAIYTLLRKHRDLPAILAAPMALGLGPAFAAYFLEILIWLFPTTNRWTAVLLLTVMPLSILIRNRTRCVAAMASRPAITINAIVLLGVMWILGGTEMVFTWDPTCFRLLADRIATDRIIHPVDLALSPTINGLKFVHAFHGDVFLMLLTLNRVVAGINTVGLDGLPSIWYFWATVLLAGGAAAGSNGWQSLKAWSAAALLLSSHLMMRWAAEGQSTPISAFFLLALFLFCERAYCSTCRRKSRNQTLNPDWLLAGTCLGFSLGIHRIALAFTTVYALFALAAYLRMGRSSLRHTIIGLIPAVVIFGPYGFANYFALGGLDRANPVSNRLVPYRSTWREGFQPPAFIQAVEQFWTPKYGAQIWIGYIFAELTALLTIWRKKLWKTADARKHLMTLSLVFLFIVVFCDLTLVLKTMGMELIVRSQRYRTILLPVLVYCLVVRLTWIRSIWKPRTRPTPPGRIAPLSGTVLLWGSLFITQALLGTSWQPPYLQNAAQTVREKFMPDSVLIERRIPDSIAVVKALDAASISGTLLVDYPIFYGLLNTPMRSVWLNPGAFNLLEANSPAQMHSACLRNGISSRILSIRQGGAELESSSGLRNFIDLSVSRLICDTDRYQVFQLRNRLAENAVRMPATIISGRLRQAIATGSREKTLPLFDSALAVPGDYELEISFDAREVLTFRHKRAGMKTRIFNLRSWHPYKPGPQRIRFLISGDVQVRFDIHAANPDIWQNIRSIRLFRIQGPHPASHLAPESTRK